MTKLREKHEELKKKGYKRKEDSNYCHFMRSSNEVIKVMLMIKERKQQTMNKN